MKKITVNYFERDDSSGQIRVGSAACPHCKKENVLVLNDKGMDGTREFDYLENHHKKNGLLCPKSQVLFMFVDLE